MSEECESEPNTSEKIKVINCETVDAVFDALEGHRREVSSPVFRGVKDAGYDLRPSLWRDKGEVYEVKDAVYNKLTREQKEGLKDYIEYVCDWISIRQNREEFKAKIKETRLDASKLFIELLVELDSLSQFIQTSNIAGLVIPKDENIELERFSPDIQLFECGKGTSANPENSDFEVYVERLLKDDIRYTQFIKTGLISIIDFRLAPNTIGATLARKTPRPSIFGNKQNESLLSHSILFKQNRLPQHQGVPTRLLDVTHDPYVALFFASEPPSKEESNIQDQAVYVIDTKKTSMICFVEHHDAPNYADNTFCFRQKAGFMEMDHKWSGKYFLDNGQWPSLDDAMPQGSIRKIVFSVSIGNSIRQKLSERSYGITKSYLMPTYSNVAEEMVGDWKAKYLDTKASEPKGDINPDFSDELPQAVSGSVDQRKIQ